MRLRGFLQEFTTAFGVKNHTIDEHIEADAQGPDVSDLAMVRGPLTHFRGKEGWGAHGAHCCVSMIHHTSTAKVTDLDSSVRCQQHVVRLEVTVHYVLGM